MKLESAEENLELIRRLMERSSIYRLVASHSALTGGVLSLGLGIGCLLWSEHISLVQFFVGWLIAFLIVDGINAFSLFRDAKSRGQKFPSGRTRHAIVSMLPGFLLGGLVSFACLFLYRDPVNATVFWATGVGIALLGTSSFSPKSIPVLGWFFLLAGLGYFAWRETLGRSQVSDDVAEAGLFMATVFGLGLLSYGFATLRKSKN